MIHLYTIQYLYWLSNNQFHYKAIEFLGDVTDDFNIDDEYIRASLLVGLTYEDFVP